jgi:hypothetical protein
MLNKIALLRGINAELVEKNKTLETSLSDALNKNKTLSSLIVFYNRKLSEYEAKEQKVSQPKNIEPCEEKKRKVVKKVKKSISKSPLLSSCKIKRRKTVRFREEESVPDFISVDNIDDCEKERDNRPMFRRPMHRYRSRRRYFEEADGKPKQLF